MIFAHHHRSRQEQRRKAALARTYLYIYARGEEFELCDRGILVEQPEHPEGDAVKVPNFGIVNSQVAVGEVSDLGECLAFSSYFEDEGVVNKEVTRAVECQMMCRMKLIDKKSLSDSANLGIGSHGIEHIRVFHVELLWLAQLIETALVAVEHDDEAGLLKKMAHPQYSLARCFYLSPKVGEVDGEWYHTGEDNEETFHLGRRDILYVLHSRQIRVNDIGDDLLNSLCIALPCLAVKGIIAMTEVFCEERENLCLGCDVEGNGFMGRKQLRQGKFGKRQMMFQHEILAEGEPLHIIENAATREVGRGLVQLQHGGTAEDDIESGITVVDILQFLRPCAERVAMHFIDEKMGAAMREMVVGEVQQTMICEPKVIQRAIKSLSSPEVVELDVLKHHRGLANASCTTDAEHTHVPVHKIVQIAFEPHVHSLRKAS